MTTSDGGYPEGSVPPITHPGDPSPYPPPAAPGYGTPAAPGYPPAAPGYPPAGPGYPPATQGYGPPAGPGYPPAVAGYGPPAAQGGASGAAAPATNGVATAALVVGLFALVLSIIPVINAVAVLGGLVGVGLGIAGLRRARRGAAGRGKALAGVLVSVAAALIGAVVFALTVGAFVEGFQDGFEQAQAGFEEGITPVEGTDPVDGTNDGDGAGSLDEGEWVDLPRSLPLGKPATVGRYQVTVTAIATDANAAVAAADPTNPAPTGRYVTADLTVTNTGVADAVPFDDLLASYLGTDSYLYDEYSCAAFTATSVYDVGTLAPGATASYTVCMDVPVEAIGNAEVVVESAVATSFDGAVWAQ